MKPAKNKFEELYDDTERSTKLMKGIILLTSAGGVFVLVSLFFGAVLGIGFAIVYAYVVNKILQRPRQSEK